MGAIFTRDSFALQGDKTLNQMVMKNYAESGRVLEQFFKDEGDKRGSYYSKAEISGLNHVREIPEGGSVTYDVPVEGNKKTLTYKQFGNGFMVTEIALEDELFGKIEKCANTLGKAAAYKEEVDRATMLVLGMTSELSWDGVSLFNTAHPILKPNTTVVPLTGSNPTTISNKGAAALSETALQAAFETFMNMVGSEGRPLELTPDTLLITPADAALAHRLITQLVGINATAGQGSTDQLNLVNPKNGFVGGYNIVVSPVLGQVLQNTANKPFFLFAKNELDLLQIYKRQFRFEKAVDNHNGNRLYRGTMRYGIGAFDWRGSYCGSA